MIARVYAIILTVLYSVGPPITAQAESQPPMAIDDVLLDRDTLVGKSVTVHGYVACVGANAICMVFDDPASFTKNLMFNSVHQSRADRARLNTCNVLSHCEVTITGIVIRGPLESMKVLAMNWGQGDAPPSPEVSTVPSVMQSVVSVPDFLLDSAQMKGRTATVRGNAWCDGTSCVIQERGWMTEQSARFSDKALPRDDRRKLLSCLSGLAPGCAAEITGVVTGEGALEARSIAWR